MTAVLGHAKPQCLLVFMAVDGEEALKMCHEKRFDVILMDMKMPGMSGLETARRLQGGINSDVPIVMISASPPTEEIGSLCKAYINKPVKRGELLKVLDEVLASEKGELSL